MFHIVGTNHDLQHDGKPVETSRPEADRARARLRAYLLTLTREIIAQSTAPVVIAEELSEWYLRYKRAGSVAQAVAAELCIAHRFCDPDPGKRKALCLADLQDTCAADLLRECYWLACLLDVAKHDVLFVCGAVHVTSFGRLLRNRGIPVKVRARYFGKKLFTPCAGAVFRAP